MTPARNANLLLKLIPLLVIALLWLTPDELAQDPPPATPPAPPTPVAPANNDAILPDSGPPADVLPAPGVGATTAPDAAPTTVPAVSLRTVLTPRRLVWLFIAGLIVFTVSYGVQVAIWYRLKR